MPLKHNRFTCVGCRIVQRRRQPKGVPRLLFGQNLLKTAWKWRKWDRNGEASKILLCRSATDYTWMLDLDIDEPTLECLLHYFRSPKVPRLVPRCSLGEKQKNQGKAGGWGCIQGLHPVQIHFDCSVQLGLDLGNIRYLYSQGSNKSFLIGLYSIHAVRVQTS